MGFQTDDNQQDTRGAEGFNSGTKRYKDNATQELLDVASCLDPWFKMDFISADKKP